MDADPDIHSARLPRFERHRFRKPPLELQPRDEQIIQLVADHRFISSDDIQLLIPGSDQGVLRRLQKLFHGGYVDRPRVQRLNGNAPMVYALGHRGAELLHQKTGRQVPGDWSEKNRQVRNQYLEHGLMVSRFHTALRHTCEQVGTVRLECWLGDGAITDSVVIENAGRHERIPIRPDAFCILNVLDGQRPGRVHVFLEADRGTMTVDRFVTKLRGYYAYWRSGAVEERHKFKNFLVLTTTRSTERAVNLVKAARSVSDQGLRMFLFGTEADYLPAVRTRVLDAIWRSPDGGTHALIE